MSGGYQAFRTYLDPLQITQLVLEYATERAGTLVEFEGKEIGLGVVNPRADQVETPEQIRAAVEDALRFYPAERMFLNPDCGFGTFSNRPMSTLEIASARVAAMTAAARDLRSRSQHVESPSTPASFRQRPYAWPTTSACVAEWLRAATGPPRRCARGRLVLRQSAARGSRVRGSVRYFPAWQGARTSPGPACPKRKCLVLRDFRLAGERDRRPGAANFVILITNTPCVGGHRSRQMSSPHEDYSLTPEPRDALHNSARRHRDCSQSSLTGSF